MTDYYPNLETERLLLRQLAPTDIDFVFAHFGDPTVTQFMLDEPPITSRDEANEIIEFYQDQEKKPYNRWGIVRKMDDQLIGTVGFHKWDKRYFRAEVGYDLTPSAWGQGYMTEALTAAIQNGFDRMELNRIDALVYPKNLASTKLLARLGFQQEGVLRDYFYLNGQFYDHSLWALLKADW